MMQMIKMAFRNLGRNKRRTFFSALGLGAGLALLLLMAAVLKGEMRASLDMSIRLQSGHVQVRAKTYEPDRSSLAWEDLVEDPETLAAQIAALPPVVAATPRLFASGIVTAGRETVGVALVGIDPASPASAPYRDGLVSGSVITADDREGVLIGRKLAETLGLATGDTLMLLANTADGGVEEQPFTVRGLFVTGSPFYDQTTVFLPLAKAQTMTHTEGHASSIFVLLDDRDQTGAVAAALQSDRYAVVTWQQMNDLLTQMEQMSSGMLMVLYLLVLGITATVIVNTLIMSVFERTREIGILSAMGMRGRRIMGLFFLESVLLAAGGVLIGLVLGGLMVWYASKVGIYVGNFGIEGIMMGERIYADLVPSDALMLVSVAFVVSLLAALYPARLAARMEPVTALHTAE